MSHPSTLPPKSCADTAADDAATRLRAAIGTGRELTTIGDALVEQFAVEPRNDGLSWKRIGEFLGTTTRAQKRYPA